MFRRLMKKTKSKSSRMDGCDGKRGRNTEPPVAAAAAAIKPGTVEHIMADLDDMMTMKVRSNTDVTEGSSLTALQIDSPLSVKVPRSSEEQKEDCSRRRRRPSSTRNLQIISSSSTDDDVVIFYAQSPSPTACMHHAGGANGCRFTFRSIDCDGSSNNDYQNNLMMNNEYSGYTKTDALTIPIPIPPQPSPSKTNGLETLYSL